MKSCCVQSCSFISRPHVSFFTGLVMFSAVSFEKIESAHLVNVPCGVPAWTFERRVFRSVADA